MQVLSALQFSTVIFQKFSYAFFELQMDFTAVGHAWSLTFSRPHPENPLNDLHFHCLAICSSTLLRFFLLTGLEAGDHIE